MELIKTVNISKLYKVENKDNYALKDFSFEFPSSGLFGVVGKSGSGKSTLLNMISLLDKPSSGDVYFNNENVSKWSNKRKNLFHNKDMGMVFQHYNLIETENVLFNIMLPFLITGGSEKEGKKKAISLLESIDYRKDLYQQTVSNLSGGEKQRVAILRALINDPQFILADEPTGALDSRNSEVIMKMLKDISKTKLVIMVAHNIKLVEKYADKIITLKDGNLIETKEEPTLKRKRGRRKNEQ